MTNWEKYFGTPERAARTLVEVQTYPLRVNVMAILEVRDDYAEWDPVAWQLAYDEYARWLKMEYTGATDYEELHKVVDR